MRLGVLGGSFDPPHAGHLSIAAMALSLGDLDELLVVPCFSHALGKRLTPFEHRFAMCALAFRDIRRTSVSDVEARLAGTSYTLRTVRRLARDRPEAKIVLVVGADAIEEKDSWHRFGAIEQEVELLVFGRVGNDLDRPVLPAPPAVSSTEVRAILRRAEDASRLVPAQVLRYAEEHDLYRS